MCAATKEITVYHLHKTVYKRWVSLGKPKEWSEGWRNFTKTLSDDEKRVFKMRDIFLPYLRKKSEFYNAIKEKGEYPYQKHFSVQFYASLTDEEKKVREMLLRPLDPPGYTDDPPCQS